MSLHGTYHNLTCTMRLWFVLSRPVPICCQATFFHHFDVEKSLWLWLVEALLHDAIQGQAILACYTHDNIVLSIFLKCESIWKLKNEYLQYITYDMIWYVYIVYIIEDYGYLYDIWYVASLNLSGVFGADRPEFSNSYDVIFCGQASENSWIFCLPCNAWGNSM